MAAFQSCPALQANTAKRDAHTQHRRLNMPTKLQDRTLLPIHGRFLTKTDRETMQAKAAQREFYMLVAVFLGSLTLVSIAIVLSAAVMLANAGL
jgi:hypothetical protein